jgi:hypothetical protein
MISLRALAPYVAASPVHAREPRCEICNSSLGVVHRHVVELGKRGVLCACQACAVLFAHAASGAQFRTVPQRYLTDRMFAPPPERWAALGIPVTLAFFYEDSIRNTVVACYPGPAGIVDADLDAFAWSELLALTSLAPLVERDVEALVVRGGRAEPSCHLVPITAAYELVSRLRASWQGFTGGDAAERELARFFADVERRGGSP